MDITPLIPSNKKIITGYGGGVFKINNEPFAGDIIIFPTNVIKWPVNSGILTLESLSSALENTDIEILIIGCGKEHMMLPADIKRNFLAKNINIDIMTTGAACRTYNVLLGEDRHVAAALMAV